MSKNLGIDVGFGFVKATDGHKNVIFPSVVGEWRKIRYSTGINNTNKLDNLILETNESKYFIGNLANKQSELILSTLSQDRIGSTENIVLFYAALGLLCDQQDYVNVVTGLPVNEYSDKLKKKLIDQFSGKHKFTLNEKTYIIYVKNIKVIPQPLGTIFNELLTEHGKVLNPEYENMKVGIIDIGFRTSDFAVTDKLAYIDRLSSTTETALSNSYKYIARTLNNDHGVNIPLYQIQNMVKNKVFIYNNTEYDISVLIEKAYKITANNIISEVQSLWKMWEIEKIVLTGGGSAKLYDYIINRLDQADISHDPQFANVRGYLKMANRSWRCYADA